MQHEEFINELSVLLEIEPEKLTGDFELKRLVNWDSLTIVSVIGLLETLYSVQVKIEDVEKIETINQILTLTENVHAS